MQAHRELPSLPFRNHNPSLVEISGRVIEEMMVVYSQKIRDMDVIIVRMF